MSIEFNCGVCQRPIRVPNEAAGEQAKCPFCSNVQPVPGAGEAYPASQATPPTAPPRATPPPPPPPPPTAPPTPPKNPYADPVAAPTVNPYTSPAAAAEARLAEQYARFRLAGRGERFLGFLIDFSFWIVCLLPGIAIGIISEQAGRNDLDQVAGVVMFLGLLACWGIQWTLITKTSQSVGKRFMKTKIVKLDGGPPGFVHGVILRIWAITFISFPVACVCYPISPFIPLIDGLFVFGERCQCLHDLIASTVVVVADE